MALKLWGAGGGGWLMSNKPELFGNSQHNLLGHYSGPWAVRAKAKELGLVIPDGKEENVIEKLRSKIKDVRRQINDQEFINILENL